ncbi:hypothetical protein CEXT_159691 [Caerostris extrusa]|uniref:Uncharacterized protein n=1 Tax=Caerostris extrusa TaxID=172846 RepID=A0AAV4NDF8_CAEEX|nr:hypothetical protein CEXT_159691 [Caerostris extrusa]
MFRKQCHSAWHCLKPYSLKGSLLKLETVLNNTSFGYNPRSFWPLTKWFFCSFSSIFVKVPSAFTLTIKRGLFFQDIFTRTSFRDDFERKFPAVP